MKISQKMQDAVRNHDLETIRSCLYSRISVDLGFSTGAFDEYLNYATDKGISESEIFQPHKGEEPSLDATEENIVKLSGDLFTNFSKKRFEALKKVGRAVYPSKTENVDTSTGMEYSSSKTNSESEIRYKNIGDDSTSRKTDEKIHYRNKDQGGASSRNSDEKIHYRNVGGSDEHHGNKLITGAAVGAVGGGFVGALFFGASVPTIAVGVILGAGAGALVSSVLGSN